MVWMEKIKPGEILYQKKRVRQGNTTISKVVIYEVKILSVNPEENFARVSWNGNQPSTWRRKDVEKLTRRRPVER